MNNFFIPSINTVNNVKVPSTPFFDKNKKEIYLGDVVEVLIELDEDADEPVNFLVELKNGCYVLTKPHMAEPILLGEIEAEHLNIVGSSVADEKLFDLV